MKRREICANYGWTAKNGQGNWLKFGGERNGGKGGKKDEGNPEWEGEIERGSKILKIKRNEERRNEKYFLCFSLIVF